MLMTVITPNISRMCAADSYLGNRRRGDEGGG
jgi:hypothetical protein